MRQRSFGRTGWQVGEIGYGMWGMAAWSGADDEESRRSLLQAVDLGCSFFDTAWAYGAGHSERLLGELLRATPEKRIYSASKIPPKNGKWPARADYALDDVFPADHIREFTERTLANLGRSSIDLMQFHVWNDAWADDPRWQRAVTALRDEGLIKAIGISINRWEPENGLRALRTGLIDAVQVVYNVFDQAPEDELFGVCQAMNIAVIARVPFDEGTLTGTLTLDSRWPEGDFRNVYFAGDKLRDSVAHAEALRAVLPAGMTMPEFALRWILSNPAVSVVIPGMRKPAHVAANLAASDAGPLSPELMSASRAHRWDRRPGPQPD
ncbi:MAG TPA: aldo/keto reductase [Vicinamibacterales bacterium]|nr:aldo/keto reductase [Vicinamibacterales bacterium]